MKVNIGERKFERAAIEDDTYSGEISEVVNFETTDYNGKPTEKVRVEITLDKAQTDGNEVVLPLFVSANISDAGEHSDTHNNSKLYDLLVASGNKEALQKVYDEVAGKNLSADEQSTVFLGLLHKVLVGNRVKVLSKTVTPTKGDDYSVVDKIVKFLKTPGKEKPEEITIE